MSYLPEISAGTQALLRSGYGILIFCTILWTLFPGRWFFHGARWGGYGDDRDFAINLLQNPFSRLLLTGLWTAAAVGLITGTQTVLCALINLAVCWFYFVRCRWNSLLRGMGAPGFFCYWLGAVTLFLELGRYMDPSGRILAVVVLVAQVDFALIQLCAGSYKSVCGYSANEGMQLGLANPFWGHHWRFYKKMKPAHPLFVFLNQVSYRVQIGAALLMLFPATRLIGALAIAASFLFVMTQIRLGFLLPKVMISSLLFVQAGSAADKFLGDLFGAPHSVQQTSWVLPPWASLLITSFLLTYLVLLPLAKACQWYNLLKGRSFPAPLQSFLEKWANAFGIIIWRVFSVDVINFFVRIYSGDEEYTTLGKARWNNRFRYIMVAESIALTSIFTTLKSHPADSEFFTDKLVRYARTVPCGRGQTVRFAYHELDYSGRHFEFVHTVDYIVDPKSGTVEVVNLREHLEGPSASPVRPGARPGSYLPVLEQTV